MRAAIEGDLKKQGDHLTKARDSLQTVIDKSEVGDLVSKNWALV